MRNFPGYMKYFGAARNASLLRVISAWEVFSGCVGSCVCARIFLCGRFYFFMIVLFVVFINRCVDSVRRCLFEDDLKIGICMRDNNVEIDFIFFLMIKIWIYLKCYIIRVFCWIWNCLELKCNNKKIIWRVVYYVHSIYISSINFKIVFIDVNVIYLIFAK